jgi:hypothetical protein
MATKRKLEDYKAAGTSADRKHGFFTAKGVGNPGRSFNPNSIGGVVRVWAALSGSAAAAGGGLAKGLSGHEATARAVIRLILLAWGTVGNNCHGGPFSLPPAILKAVEAFGPSAFETTLANDGLGPLYPKAPAPKAPTAPEPANVPTTDKA